MRVSFTEDLAAAAKKWRVISRRERAKLAVKLALSVFGVRLPLYLGGFYAEEDRRQREQDRAIYRKLQQEQEGTGYFALVTERLDQGGLEEVVGRLAEELRSRGTAVKIFCLQSGGEMAQKLMGKGMDVLVFHGDRDRLREYCRSYRPRLANTHSVSHWLEVFLEEAIPVVEVIHNTYVFMDAGAWERERRKTACVSRYIAVSAKAADTFLEHVPKFPSARIRVIENGTAAGEAPFISREEMRRRFAISEDTFVYIAVGSIDARKNQIGLLRAWNIVSGLIREPCVLVIAGAGTDAAYEEKVKALAASMPPGHFRVIFTGHSPQVKELLNMSDAFVLASYYEGCSMAAIEALMAGLPLIHTDCGNGARLTADGRNGILVDNPLSGIEAYGAAQLYDAIHAGRNENIEQLVRAMYRIWRDRDTWRARRKETAEYAAEHFNAGRMAEGYLEVFRQVIQEGR